MSQSQLSTEQLLFEEKPLYVPPLSELQNGEFRVPRDPRFEIPEITIRAIFAREACANDLQKNSAELSIAGFWSVLFC